MVYKIKINDNQDSPLVYLPDLDNFQNGQEYNFIKGVNIIVGANGCGKTTLLKLIEDYLMVGKDDCDRGEYNSNIHRLYAYNKKFNDGIDVYADYTKNTFRLCHAQEKNSDDAMKTFSSFGTFYEQKHSSTGESVNIALGQLFNNMFGKEAKLTYDYSQFKESHPYYYEYVNKHKKNDDDAYTILMDEPDRNLDIDNIETVKNILSYKKEQTQIIAVVHNPLLIYYLSRVEHINMIEMTEGYIKKINRIVRELTK